MSELSYKTLRENAASAIRMKILNQELAPGTRIIEQNLSKEFGISRGPIREALRQLEQEGLVVYTRNAGCSVKEITLADVYEIYLLRANYETLAVQLCGGCFSREELGEMNEILEIMQTLQTGDLARLLSCDHMLHEIIVRKARLPRLLKAWEELNFGNMVAAANGSFSKEQLADRQYTIHQELVCALYTGKQDIICHAIYTHYMRPVKQLILESGLPMEDYKFFDHT